jgi:hypothetical protein
MALANPVARAAYHAAYRATHREQIAARKAASYIAKRGPSRTLSTSPGAVWSRRYRARLRGDLSPFRRKFEDLWGHAKMVDGCMEWQGARISKGYGEVRVPGVGDQLVSRLVLEMVLGRPLAPGMFACHTCDNPPCFLPDHLFEGTQADNVHDMKAKGRDRHWGRQSIEED